MDFSSFFTQYEQLVAQVEAVFKKITKEYAPQVNCKLGCSDCCHALFDISLIEAIYIKDQFDRRIIGPERSDILERVNKVDRAIHQLKRKAFKDHEAGRPEEDIIEEMAGERVRCPMLDDQEQCFIYDIRPITCRLYGVPTEIGGRSHTCGLSGFVEGESYPTVKMDNIHQRLYEISSALTQSIQTKYPNLGELIVPLSMALLTDYTEDYLGVKEVPVQNDINKE